MAHLDTAYKLGALRAMEDFQTELHKLSALPDISGASRAVDPSARAAQQAIQARPAPRPTIDTSKARTIQPSLGNAGPGGFKPGETFR